MNLRVRCTAGDVRPTRAAVTERGSVIFSYCFSFLGFQPQKPLVVGSIKSIAGGPRENAPAATDYYFAEGKFNLDIHMEVLFSCW